MRKNNKHVIMLLGGNMDNSRIRISLIMNILVVTFTVIACIVMFTGFQFMSTDNFLVLESTKLGMFKFFTVDSNILMGLSSLIFTIYEYKLLYGKIKEIPKSIYLLKLIATTAVSITFIVVFLYLGPISKGGIYSMLLNSNLFFHLFIPVLSIITFMFYEKTDKLNLKSTLYGLLPTILYSFYYLANILIHMKNGKVSSTYDWYYFAQNGVWNSVIILPVMLLASYVICLLLWKANRIHE